MPTAPSGLLAWFATAARPLPWRAAPPGRRDPWGTLVCEVMSQQTRIEVVEPRWREWMARWPDPASLARVPEDTVLAAWAGLGYYSRARNLYRCAQALVERGWPRDARGLAALPGLGSYTAAAVASLAFGEHVAMVDGNVLRVLARLARLPGDLRAGAGRRRLEAVAAEWIAEGDAPAINEATIELGASLCRPRSPRCEICPVSPVCEAHARDDASSWPQARPRPERLRVERSALVAVREGAVLLRRAEPGELLAGLWILPAVGEDAHLEASGPPWGEVRHAITRHDVVWSVGPGRWRGGTLPGGWAWCPPDSLREYLVSSLPRKALRLAGLDPDAPDA